MPIPTDYLEEFEERAAILEYDGLLSPEDAEAQAEIEIMERVKRDHGKA